MKIFLTGASGTLGTALFQALNNEHEIYCVFNRHKTLYACTNSVQLDLSDFSAIEKCVKQIRPNIILHTAAITTTSEANQTSKDQLNKLNTELPGLLAGLCNEVKSEFYYFSTDLVYNSKDELNDEESELKPLNIYAESKLKGEEAVINQLKEAAIIRIALLLNSTKTSNPGHFFNMVNNLKASGSVNLYSNQFRTPVSVSSAALVIKRMIDKKIFSGTYNLGGGYRLSRLELGELVCKFMGINKEPLISNEMNDLHSPKDVSMTNKKLADKNIFVEDFETSLKKLLKRF